MPHKCLGSAYGQGLGGAGKAQRLLGTGFVHQRNGLLGGSVLQAKAVFTAPGGERFQHFAAGGAGEQAVNGLHLNGRRVYIAQLYQTQPGGVITALLLGEVGLDLVPMGFGGGQAVVAVAHGHHQRGLPGCGGIAGIKHLAAGQALQRGHNALLHGLVGDAPAAKMAALQHQIKVIGKGIIAAGIRQGLNHGFFGIVQQHHHMGQFQHSAAAHGQTGRNALHHRVFAGADQRLGAFFIAVVL